MIRVERDLINHEIRYKKERERETSVCIFFLSLSSSLSLLLESKENFSFFVFEEIKGKFQLLTTNVAKADFYGFCGKRVYTVTSRWTF